MEGIENVLVVYSLVRLLTCSDRFLPDKAIDLIDEAGSRVRLRHAQVKNSSFGRSTVISSLFVANFFC